MAENWRLWLPLVLGVIAIVRLMTREGRRNWLISGVAGLSGVLLLQHNFVPVEGVTDWFGMALFFLFGGGAVLSGAMMITDHNPVYAALWFAVATLSVCGLFLLNAAPFLAAATVIVYAGAIVVTFVFVIMLAQQAGATNYDRKSNQPVLATVAGALLLGAILLTVQDWSGPRGKKGQSPESKLAAAKFMLPPAEMVANPLSLPEGPGQGDLGSLKGVGRSLFGDYLFAVEIAGTVLLVATIAAIALAPRRAQGTL